MIPVSPDGRLVVAAGAWVLAAALAVVWPALWLIVWLAAAGLLGAVVADAVLLWRRPAARLQRRVPERLAVGSPAELVLELGHPGPGPLEAAVFDEVPNDLRDGDPSWERVVLGPGEEVQLPYEVRPRVRGDRALGPAVALCRSPLGLLRRRVTAGAGELARVYPDASRFLRPEALDPKNVLSALGVKRARQRGEGLDFESLREYVPGDDPRRIDWRATARRGRLVTRLYQHERNHTVVIAVDGSRLMGGRTGAGERTKLDCAVDSALALVYAALAAGDRAGLAVFDSEARSWLEPRGQRAELGRFVDALRTVDSRLVEADYRVLTRTLLARHSKRSLVVILTDFADVDPASVVTPLALLARRHRVLLVLLRDRSFEALDARRAAQAWSDRGLYRRVVLDEMLREREETLARLRQHGLHTLDLASEQVTAAVLNRYLEIRYAGG